MYTDDNVIISRCPQGPQKCLGAPGQYCNEWRQNYRNE